VNPGDNIIRRRDTDSTVTISYERTFRNYAAKEPPEETPEFEQYNYCGCGWPAHLLIPKGSAEGFKCLLFVMVSNYEEDRVDQSLDGICNDAASFCGIRDRKYPDRKAMGYPFDRLAREGCETLDDFLTPNMCVQRCTVFHTDTYIKKSR
jgi:tyrosinase